MATKDKKIPYTSQEIYPYLPESDLVYAARYLPEHMQNAENDIRILMPCHGLVSERRNQPHEVIRLSDINIIVDNYDHPLVVEVAPISSTRIQAYFIDDADLFERKSLFGPPSEGTSSDNAGRSIFFIRGVLEAVKSLYWIPGVIHCLGWFSTLAPAYLKAAYKNDPHFERAKVFSSVDGNEGKDEVDEDLIKKPEFDKTTGDSLDPLQGEMTPDAPRRTAVHYSDGVIPGRESISSKLIEYLRLEPDHEVLEYPDPAVDHVEAYIGFYHSFMEQGLLFSGIYSKAPSDQCTVTRGSSYKSRCSLIEGGRFIAL